MTRAAGRDSLSGTSLAESGLLTHMDATQIPMRERTAEALRASAAAMADLHSPADGNDTSGARWRADSSPPHDGTLSQASRRVRISPHMAPRRTPSGSLRVSAGRRDAPRSAAAGLRQRGGAAATESGRASVDVGALSRSAAPVPLSLLHRGRVHLSRARFQKACPISTG